MKEILKIKTNTKGITLIALVVTIIVLLILAGVSIMTLVGENGILTQAQKAKQETEVKSAEEKAKLAVISAVAKSKDGTINIDDLIYEITNNYGGQANSKNGTFPVTATIDGKKFTIKDDGTVKENVGTLNSSTEGDITNSNKINLNWSELKQASEIISEDDNINENTASVTVKIGEKTETLTIGNYTTVKYEGNEKKVRIIGFNTDTKKDGSKAGITFDFITTIDNEKMNSTYTNTDGWGKTNMKMVMETFLNKITLDENMQLSSIVEEVKKDYIKTYNDENSIVENNYDKLWLLADSEIFSKNDDNNRYALAIAKEGTQYKYYALATNGIIYKNQNSKLVKYISYENSTNTDSNSTWWWLRSPYYNYSNDFCYITNEGYGDYNANASYSGGVAPGFCI